MASTLAMLCEHFHLPTMTRDVQEYVLSCGSWRRKRSTMERIAVLPDHAPQPWEVLKIDRMRVGVTYLTHNSKYERNLLLAVDEASSFRLCANLSRKSHFRQNMPAEWLASYSNHK